MCHLWSFITKLFTNSLFIILGDQNARFSSCWKEGETTAEGTHWEPLTCLHNFHQLIAELTHILPNYNLCVDLIFTNQPNLIVTCGASSSLNSQCHHQIPCSKLNINVEYSPPYEWLVQDYKKANTKSIKKPIEIVKQETLFQNETVNKPVFVFNEIILNIFSNFVPTNLVTYDDNDSPWMNDCV